MVKGDGDVKQRNRREVLGDAVRLSLGAALGVHAAPEAGSAEAAVLERDTGYRGIWYYNQPSGDEYVYKYSGGFATYPQQHVPIAHHASAVRKTFFVYGGTIPGQRELLHMVSYYDHATGQVPRPRILLNKKTNDAHDNPTLTLDSDGHLWIFSNSHGTGRPSYIHRSREPYSIEAFERVYTGNFSYGQPWHVPGNGFVFLHTRYVQGRRVLHWMTSPDGRAWGEPQRLAEVEQGHYQISWRDGSRLATAFNFHPKVGGLNARTNLYYLETRDGGATWTAAGGKTVQPPLTEIGNAALVRDYQCEKLLVYLKDLAFDGQGRPVVLFLTSRGYESGPKNEPRTLTTAAWNGATWDFRPVTTTEHNYDYASLYLERDGTWRIIGSTEPGPQAWCTGGEIAAWVSRDRGGAWRKERQITQNSRFNHTFPRRPVNAHPDFYALWADGDAKAPSESSLYFSNQRGDRVRRFPTAMAGDFAQPEEVRV